VRIRFGTFTLDIETRQLTSAGREIHLEPKAFELLSALVLERPKALSKADLQERLWPGTFVSEANLSNLVAQIRAALGDPARASKFVRTAHRFGYAFCGEAVTSTDDACPTRLPDPPSTSSASSDGLKARTQTFIPAPRATRVAWLIAAVLAVALIATAVIERRRGGDLARAGGPAQFTIAAPERASFGGPSRGGSGVATQLAVSPDGRQIVFVARAKTAYQIWLRPVASLTAAPIPGTDGGTFPFWSPDSRSVGFFADGKLKTVPIGGGPPIVLADAPGGSGGSWSRDNVVLFAPGPSQTGLLRISSTGGVATVATTLDKTAGEDVHRWPHFLPDGRHFFYTAVTGPCCPAANPAVIRIGSLDSTGPGIPLLQAESAMTYASGHVLYARDEALMAQPFDLQARQIKGEAFRIADGVGTEGSRYVSASVSETGTLVYAPKGFQAAPRLTWFDRRGHVLGTLGEPAPYLGVALSPDESRVAVSLGTGHPKNVDIWVIDTATSIRSRLTTDAGRDVSPVWSRDGTRLAFQSSRRAMGPALRQAFTSAARPDELLLEGTGNFTMTPSDWSSDGRFILYTTRGSDIWALPLFGDRKPFALAQTPFTETSAVFSPDGRWIAYTSNEGGQPDVYVRSFPGDGNKWQVSKDGGGHPLWRADGKELFYLAADGSLMAVSIDPTSPLTSSLPEPLFPTGAATFGYNQAYGVTKDGQRFLVSVRPQPVSDDAPLTIVLNWTAAIRH
jgi:Tol biopolymer transport system component/DNA-binding winged helix-turn-helix (wHTH) protein